MARANENAVAGVKARNGAKKTGSNQRTGQRDTAVRPVLASALTAVLDSQGMVVGVLAGRAAARAFLREARL
ncbi:hypothetical protein [Methylobacterium radiotolerans]|uniref:Uncharacterized protein n=1 Tax=Methylobacterium radiotolerans (strain ATCC 27329 / DSM 1819 / JCM 2831 / NBRC 15690 / NCIMB 10815 / 0-1) TaxID=426355 RepID=B1LW58_METRJ|nr:hypothetical protein [Methylobacterium radiotolerans]ACB27121.1 hypothetical protein Mrad2831_5164 [Methylobacterium radiotolerans JCM 2831]GEN00245.1 hypothetical protein MRA01_47840 [Methylobacterium radiotolerans]